MSSLVTLSKNELHYSVTSVFTPLPSHYTISVHGKVTFYKSKNLGILLVLAESTYC